MSSNAVGHSPAAAGRADLPLRGIGFGLAAAFLLSSQDALIKLLSGGYPILQIVFVRAGIGCAAAAAWILCAGKKGDLHSRRPALAAARVFCMFVALWSYYIALTMLDLAVYSCLGLTVFLFASALSGPALKEKTSRRDWLALAIGIGGVAVVVNPSADSPIYFPAAALLLFGALMWAFGIVATRALGSALSSRGLLFYTNGAVLASAVFLPLLPSFGWRAPESAADFGLFILIGLFGIGGQGMAIAAYRSARMNAVIPTQHTMLLWAALFAWILWDEIPDARLWLGGALIIGATLFAVLKKPRRKQN